MLLFPIRLRIFGALPPAGGDQNGPGQHVQKTATANSCIFTTNGGRSVIRTFGNFERMLRRHDSENETLAKVIMHMGAHNLALQAQDNGFLEI